MDEYPELNFFYYNQLRAENFISTEDMQTSKFVLTAQLMTGGGGQVPVCVFWSQNRRVRAALPIPTIVRVHYIPQVLVVMYAVRHIFVQYNVQFWYI